MLTAGADGTARIWIVDDDDLLAEADARISRPFTAVEMTRYADLLAAE